MGRVRLVYREIFCDVFRRNICELLSRYILLFTFDFFFRYLKNLYKRTFCHLCNSLSDILFTNTKYVKKIPPFSFVQFNFPRSCQSNISETVR